MVLCVSDDRSEIRSKGLRRYDQIILVGLEILRIVVALIAACQGDPECRAGSARYFVSLLFDRDNLQVTAKIGRQCRSSAVANTNARNFRLIIAWQRKGFKVVGDLLLRIIAVASVFNCGHK